MDLKKYRLPGQEDDPFSVSQGDYQDYAIERIVQERVVENGFFGDQVGEKINLDVQTELHVPQAYNIPALRKIPLKKYLFRGLIVANTPIALTLPPSCWGISLTNTQAAGDVDLSYSPMASASLAVTLSEGNIDGQYSTFARVRVGAGFPEARILIDKDGGDDNTNNLIYIRCSVSTTLYLSFFYGTRPPDEQLIHWV